MTAYVAMGSSFAAGPGLRPRVEGSPRLAGRSQVNYAHLVAAKLGLELVDVTFGGTTTTDILASQVPFVTPDTRLVTITGGGNDVGFVPALLLPSLPKPFALLGSARRVRRIGEELDANFATMEANFAKIVEGIHAIAPACRVVLVEYLTVLPPDASTPTPPLSAESAAFARGIGARLSEVTARVPWAEFVALGAASADHHAWSTVPWTMGFRFGMKGGAAYHPNAAGMAAVADLVVAQLGSDGTD
jgi:lysophospholipase L1-like esterase